MGPVLVLGIGNILLQDEGVGVHVVEELRRMDLPPGVDALDGGTSGADLIDVIADREKVIVIDATDGDGEPGTVYRFTVHDLVRRTASIGSLHEFGFLESYLVTVRLGCPPHEVVFLGIQPERIQFGLDLSEKVSRQVPNVVRLVLNEIMQDRTEPQHGQVAAR
ncbi:MAG: hydrogenase maturation protease [Acidobacteriota bacterium]